MSYNQIFSELELQNVHAGHASAYEIGIAILAEQETHQEAESTFSKIILQKLDNEFMIVRKFVESIEQSLSKDFIVPFTQGPRNYRPEGANHIMLDKILLVALVRLFVSRVDYGTRKLFYRDDPADWDPSAVTYQRLASADLSWFASEVLWVWDQLTDEFVQKFGTAFTEAAEKSKEQAKAKQKSVVARRDNRRDDRHDNRNGPRYEMKGKSAEVEKSKKTAAQQAPKRIELKAPPTENVWKKRMELVDKGKQENFVTETKEETNEGTDKGTDKGTKEEVKGVNEEEDLNDPNDLEVSLEEAQEVQKDQDSKNPDSRNQKDGKDWKTVQHKKKIVNLEVNIGGKKLIVQARVLPNGEYKQIKVSGNGHQKQKN